MNLRINPIQPDKQDVISAQKKKVDSILDAAAKKAQKKPDAEKSHEIPATEKTLNENPLKVEFTPKAALPLADEDFIELMKTAQKALAEMKEIDEKKVASIKDLIDKDALLLDPDELAQAMLDFHQGKHS